MTRLPLTFAALLSFACAGAPSPQTETSTEATPTPDAADQARDLLERLEAVAQMPSDERAAALDAIDAIELTSPTLVDTQRICLRMHRETLVLEARHRAFEERMGGVDPATLSPAEQTEARDEAEALRTDATALEALMNRCVDALTAAIEEHGLEEEYGEASSEPVAGAVDGELTDEDPRDDGDRPHDDYPIELEAGWGLEVQMTSGDFDTFVTLIGPGGSSVAEDDDGGEGTNSRLVYQPEASGVYIIRATTYQGGGRGAYHLIVRAGPLAE
ncbi:MAG: hypothetical protein EVA89_04425 [Sandaracinaceae bacterium]|nr:MAG: hypothetical protein EVA89_04425 [Sandaracinaceae bacterium]